MLAAAFACALIALHPCFRRTCAAASSSAGQESSPWLVGCADASSLELFAFKGADDLDPVRCSVLCLDERYQFAALSAEACYCGNQLYGLVVSGCFNMSHSKETKDVKGGSDRPRALRPLLGNAERGNVALYRSEGPFLHNISVSASSDRVQAGRTFVIKVSGNLAGRPGQPTGIKGFERKDLFHVTVEFAGKIPKGQSSLDVNVSDVGSFAVSSDWLLETPGKYDVDVRVSSPLSTLSSTLRLSVVQLPPGHLVISLLRGALGTPSCVPSTHLGSNNMPVEAAYWGEPVTLQACVKEGLAVQFCWCFTHEDEKKTMADVQTAGLSSSHCLNSSVNWTFDTEGVHTVSVNASSACGWTQETLHVVVVRPVVSDLKLNVSESRLTAGAGVSVDVELLTTMRHLLGLKLTLTAECNHSSENNKDLSSGEDCNHSNITYHDISQHHSNNCSHGGTPDSHPLHVPWASSRSSCRLHLCLYCRLPASPGRYRLVASVHSTSNPSSALISAVLPQTLRVYEPISVLRPSESWRSIVSTHSEFNLELSRDSNRMGLRVVWTISLDHAVVMNRTSEEWSITASLPKAGRYNLTVRAFNPVSQASFQTQILAQDTVGGLVLDVPRTVTTNQKYFVLFRVETGSNVTVCLLANTTTLYRNSSYTTGAQATAVLLFSHIGTVVIELRAENQVSCRGKSVRMSVEGKRKPSPQAKINPTHQSHAHSKEGKGVRICAEKQVYPTNTDIIFSAVADIPDPVEFFWDFGDSSTTRTTSRTITKRYQKPGRFDLIVAASVSRMSLTSDVFPVVVQRAVKLNRLVHKDSVLWNQTVTFICRVNVGNNLTFLWNFGDGTTRSGQSTERHVFHRIGEFRVEVTVSNLVSSASLSSYLFVVDRPCQPPPVKNMGPLKLQVWRHEVIHLGVTFEKEVDCDVSGGLRYGWTLFDSSGRTFPLPLTDTHRQSLTLQSHLLQYDTYTAIARVQVTGSVVYSNYTVRVEVMRSPPVAFIQGGTNIFIDKKSNKSVTLDGQASYDPDYPLNPLSYSWTCKPVSVIPSSCFNREVSTSSPVLRFPIGILKDNFDQFQFTLTVHSGERSASADAFLTLTSESVGKVSIYCPQCQGNHVNWDRSFSVSAMCEDCSIPAELIQYTWNLYLVNASSKPVIEVPFCYTVDFLAPSAIMENPATSTLTPGISTLHSSDANVSQYIHTVYVSAPAALPEDAPETNSKSENDGLADSETPSNMSRRRSNVAGLSGSEPSSSPLALDSGSGLYSDQRGQSGIISEFPNDPDSSANWEFSFPLLESGDADRQLADSATGPDSYDVLFPSVEEGDPGMSAGRPTGVDAESLSSGDESAFDQALHEEEGSNLVHPKPSLLLREPSLLDLHRDAVDRDLFESYTYTGTSAHLLTFRPFGLSRRHRYMLEVTAKSQNICLGRAQLFLKTNPIPTGMMCQVQPVKGVELHTHFGIFCTSGREDLLYEYSFSAGGRPPRMLYQGRDFQYYFSLPAGDPSDDYKVTIYTEIRSGFYGSSTKPCPVTVQVRPSFLRNTSKSTSHPDPDLKLSESGLRNLSALAQLGNNVEIRNFISLLSGVLNRLSPDAAANTHAQTHMRNVLICKLCRLESSGQVSVADNLLILKDLLQVRSQVTLTSVRLVTAHVQAVSEQLSEFSDRHYGNQRMLNTLMSLLSYSLQVVASWDYSPNSPKRDDITQTPESDLPTDESIKDFEDPHNRCLPHSSAGPHVRQGGSVSTKQVVQLVDDILQTAADLMLRHIDTEELRVGTDLINVNAAYLKDNSTIIGSGSAIFYMPASPIAVLFGHHGGDQLREDQPCVLRVLTVLAHCPYTWARHHTQLSGPVVDLSLYRCGTRRKIHIRSLSQPVSVELQLPQKNKSSVYEYSLLRSQVNYHNFSITQELLQQAIQVTVVFTPRRNNKAFPVMLLFRMFERPTPSMHHLHRIHQWDNNTTRLTLLPSYLNGVAHLALLDAHFGSVPGRKHLSEQISYRFTVGSSLCLSWDSQQGAWTHRGCRTEQVDTNPAINCSCHQLRPLTVFQQQIHSSHDKADLDPFLSVPSDLTVLGVLLLCMCLYVPGLVWCKRADAVSEENRRVHYLSDNSPADQYLYAVTVHTGLCSAARMSAKVYIVLYGEDGFSQTRELQAPGCTLFRRNSQDTFILSAADRLGPIWGVHIWHDNSGPSADWYLKHVAVSELNKGHVEGPSRLFVSQCWLAVNKGDCRVERMLRVSTHGIGFSKMLFLNLSDYLADFHIWMSVYSCPCPNSFAHTQRLCVCLLLLLGYACVNTVFISQTDDQLPFELGIIDVSAVSIKTGLVSVVAVLPAAVLISFLFRLRLIKLTRSGVQHASGRRTEQDYFEDAFSADNSKLELHLSRGGLQQWVQEAWRKKYQDTDLLSLATMILENKESGEDLVIQPDLVIKKEDALTFDSSVGPAFQKLSGIAKGDTGEYTPERSESELLSESCRFRGTKRATRDEGQTVLRGRGFRLASQWCHYVAWALCLLLCLFCLVISAVLGMSFSGSKALLWMHSLFISLMSCVFLIQPVVILAVAVTVSCLYRKRTDFQCFNLREFQIDTSKLWSYDGADQPEEEFRPPASPQTRSSYLEKLLGARQRARYLRLVRPPTPAELRKSSEKKRREALIHKTLRDLCLCGAMLLLMMCISYSSSFKEHYHLNRAVKRRFLGNHHNAFMSIKNHEDWWRWTQTSLLQSLYHNASAKSELSHIVIGDPIVQKTETSNACPSQIFGQNAVFLLGCTTFTPKCHISQVSVVTHPRTCDHTGCYSESVTTVDLGHTKPDAVSQLKLLHSLHWLGRETMALKVQCTLYSPAPNLFTSVTLLTEQNPSGALLPSAKVQSVKVYHTPAVWDYFVMVCQLLFLFLSLLQLCHQMYTAAQQGLMGYWRTPCTWVEVGLLIMTLVYYVYYIYHSIMILELAELLKRHNNRTYVDVSFAATSEQCIRALRGIILLLLTMKCGTVPRVNRTLAIPATVFSQSLSSFLWPTVAGLILLVALSCMGNLLYVQSSRGFSSLPRSLQTLLCHHQDLLANRGLLLSGWDFSFWGVVYLFSNAVWAAVGIGAMSSLVRSAKRSQSRRNVFTVAEMFSYIRLKVSEFTGKQRQTGTDYHGERRSYVLEEFESLVDELLFRLNALSDSLHHTLPPKTHHYREEESPDIISPTPESSSVDTQDSVRSQMKVNKSKHVSDRGPTAPASCLFRSQFEQQIQKVLHQRGQKTNIHSDVATDELKIKDCLACPESTTLESRWTEDICQRRAELCTKTNGSCRVNTTQTTTSKLVVEVLVHREPERELDMYQGPELV